MLRYELFPLKTCCILGGAGKPQYSSPFNHAAHCSSFMWFHNLITYVLSNKTLLLSMTTVEYLQFRKSIFLLL